MADRQDNVRSLTRGLKILRFVNAEGAARPAEISSALGIPRPTIYRLLRTLEEAGYIFFSASDSRARVSPRASGLG
ncbi:MAG: helix-turn-helix domain-containing protein, partial [Marinovum sp.]|nr:helix-turn-helix domain-containing protein [Marinovum sp.]